MITVVLIPASNNLHWIQQLDIDNTIEMAPTGDDNTTPIPLWTTST